MLQALRFPAQSRRQALRLLSACALAFGAAGLLGIPEGYWSLITAIVVMQPDLSHTFTAGRDRIIATAVGAIVGIILIALRQQGLSTLPLFAAGLLPLVCLTAALPSMRMAGVTLVVVFLIPSEGDPYSRPLYRVLEILIGALACIAVSMLIFPHENESSAARP